MPIHKEEGVNLDAATRLSGWQARVVVSTTEASEGASGHCFEPQDLVVAKLVAGRMKDRVTDAVPQQELVDPDLLLARE